MATTRTKPKEAWAHPASKDYLDQAAFAALTGLLAGMSRRSLLEDPGSRAHELLLLARVAYQAADAMRVARDGG